VIDVYLLVGDHAYVAGSPVRVLDTLAGKVIVTCPGWRYHVGKVQYRIHKSWRLLLKTFGELCVIWGVAG
jgi:hypothetical protein